MRDEDSSDGLLIAAGNPTLTTCHVVWNVLRANVAYNTNKRGYKLRAAQADRLPIAADAAPRQCCQTAAAAKLTVYGRAAIARPQARPSTPAAVPAPARPIAKQHAVPHTPCAPHDRPGAVLGAGGGGGD
jgi:hypothetical protein